MLGRPLRHGRAVAPALAALTLLAALGLPPAAGRARDEVERPAPPGRRLEEEPFVLPGGLPPPSAMPTGDLQRAIELFRAGEYARARAELETFLGASPPRDAEYLRANFLLGTLYMQRGDWQLASLHFYRVRTSEHPLAVYAAYDEAYVDYRRGKYRAAVPECEEYRTRFPEGPFYDDCELLIADAHREWGHAGTAIKLYKAYLEDHDEDHHKERIQVSIARAYEVAGNTASAARLYSALAVSHRYAVNGVAAEEGLERLRQAGVAVPEWTDQERWIRANTLKNTYRWDEAYALFQELMTEYADRPESEFYKRLEANEYSFRWQTRQYGAIARDEAARFEAGRGASGAAEHLDRAISAFNKGGDFVQAARYAEIALADFGSGGRFAGIEQDLAWYYTNAADYDAAVDAWTRCYGKRKQGFYRWMVAYTTYRAGRYEEAIDALTPLVDQGGTYAQGARFYRAKCNIALDRLGTATADFNAIIEEEPYGWYAQVIQSRRRRALRQPLEAGRARDGHWPAPARALDAPIPEPPPRRTVGEVLADLARGPFPSSRGWTPPAPERAVDVDGRPLRSDGDPGGDPGAAALTRGSADWAGVRWPVEAGEPEPVPPLPRPPSAHAVRPVERAGVAYDEEKALHTYATFVESYEEIWPLLPAAYELSRLGMRQQSAALLHDIFEEIKDAQKSRSIRKAVRAHEERLAADDDTTTPAPSAADPDAGPSAERVEPVKPAMLPPLEDVERWRRMMDIRTSGLSWRDLFILAGAPHEMCTFSVGTHRLQAAGLDEAEVRAAWRQGWPLAYGEQVWRLCQGLDLDPMMIFALMRQESTYHPTIVSPAGAIGVMQIMPGTGAKVASLARYGPYSVERLREPEVNVYFGIWYLSQLLGRYDAQFPLAIGSYNGGPHNIGRWLRSKQGIGLEEFVEEIPFNETRGYIKKVVRNYATYLAIYDPEAFVQLPRTTHPDNPEIIDF